MSDSLSSRLRLNTLKILEFARFCERKADEVHRLCPVLDELLADKIDLQNALPKVLYQRCRVVQIATGSFDAHFWFCRQTMVCQRATNKTQRQFFFREDIAFDMFGEWLMLQKNMFEHFHQDVHESRAPAFRLEACTNASGVSYSRVRLRSYLDPVILSML